MIKCMDVCWIYQNLLPAQVVKDMESKRDCFHSYWSLELYDMQVFRMQTNLQL